MRLCLRVEKGICMNYVEEHRIGRFSISRDLIISDPENVARAMQGAIVVEADLKWEGNVVYVAFKPDFDPVPIYECTPDYNIICTRHEDGTTTLEFKRSR